MFINLLKNKNIQFVLKILFSLLLLGFVLSWINAAVFWTTIASANIPLLLFSVALFFPAQILAAYRWFFLLNRLNQPVSFFSVLRHNILGQVSALVLPGQISGDVVRTIAIARGKETKAVFAVSVAIDKLALLVATSLFALAGALVSGPISQFTVAYLLILFIFISSVILLLIFGCCRIAQLQVYLEKIAQTLPFFSGFAIRLKDWLSISRLSLFDAFRVIFLGFCLQLLQTVGSYALIRSMNIVIDPIEWSAINAFVSLIQVLPLTIGGLGVREGFLARILLLYQVEAAQSTAFSLIGFMFMAIMLFLAWILVEFGSAIGVKTAQPTRDVGGEEGTYY